MILKILNILKKNDDIKFLIPIGPEFKSSQIKKFKKYKNVKLFYKIKNSLSLIDKCDLSIVSGGLTMFESLIAKKPTFVVQTSTNQKFAIDYFHKKKIITYLRKVQNLNINPINYYLKNKKKLEILHFKNEKIIEKIFKKDGFNNLINLIVSYIKR